MLPSGLKTFIIQYRNAEGIKRRVNIGRFGVITAEQARDLAKIKLGAVALTARQTPCACRTVAGTSRSSSKAGAPGSMIQLPQDIEHLFQGSPINLAINRHRQATLPSNLDPPSFLGFGRRR